MHSTFCWLRQMAIATIRPVPKTNAYIFFNSSAITNGKIELRVFAAIAPPIAQYFTARNSLHQKAIAASPAFP